MKHPPEISEFFRLTIFTRCVDRSNPRSGFFHDWLIELSKHFSFIRVLCLEVGEYDLPDNVEVVYLGRGKARRLLNFIRRNGIRRTDAVFCHQNTIYTILGWLPCKLHQKRLVMWYAHGSVGRQLKLATKLADKVLTATKESCRVGQPTIIGQGIHPKFKPDPEWKRNRYPLILTVGRISPVKRLEEVLMTPHKKVVIGEPTDQAYYSLLRRIARNTEFLGGVEHDRLPDFYQMCDVFVNNSATGSLDKACLEAMACGKPVLTSNEAVKPMLAGYDGILTFSNQQEFKDRLDFILSLPDDAYYTLCYHMLTIAREHSLGNFIDRLAKEVKK